MGSFRSFLGHDCADGNLTSMQAFGDDQKKAKLITTEEDYQKWIDQYNGKIQVYVSINPIKKGSRKFPHDTDVAYWCNEYIDLDGEKPSKDLKGYNATDEELERLKPFVEKINNWLTEHGFKTGYRDMTGNGYRWILPIPPLKLDGVNLETLAAKKKAFKERIEKDLGIVPGCGAAMDSVFDFKRITGVGGTENVKMQADDRPCRTREPFRGAVRDEDQNLRDYIMLLEIEAPAPQSTFPRTHTKTIEELMKKDPKLKRLLAGDSSGYPSPSEMDLALACKLVFYNFPDAEIEEILISVPGSDAEKKEKLGNHQYVTRTVAKAVQWTTPRIEHQPPLTPVAPASQKIAGQYEVMNFDLFRKLAARYPESESVAVEGTGVAAVYTITGDDFIKDALELEAITEYTADNGNAIVITIPEQLHSFIGNVEARLDGENTVYYVALRDQRIEFRAEEMIDLSIWRKKALYTCKLVISFDLRKHAIRDTFNLMIADIIDRAEVVWEEKYSIDDVYAQMIMTEVDKLITVDARESFARNPAAILCEEDVRYVKSATITSIHERLRIPYGMEKIRIILARYLARSSQRLMIDKKRYSCWVFKGENKT